MPLVAPAARRFFAQCVEWSAGELEAEIARGVWTVAQCSPEVVLKVREREGIKRPKPIWTDIMELIGGESAEQARQLYDGDGDGTGNADE